MQTSQAASAEDAIPEAVLVRMLEHEMRLRLSRQWR